MGVNLKVVGSEFSGKMPNVDPFKRVSASSGYRFGGSRGSLKSLTGDYFANETGSPDYFSGNCLLDSDNYITANSEETESYTAMIVFQAREEVSGVVDSPWFSSTWQRPNSLQPRGIGTFLRGQEGGSGGVIIIHYGGYMNNPGNGQSQTIGGSWNSNDFAGIGVTSWIFAALRVDAEKNEITLTLPKVSLAPVSTIDLSSAGLEVSGRDLNNSDGVPNKFTIGRSSDENIAEFSKCRISEVSYYDRVLTDIEVFQQYNLTKDYLLRTANIEI